MMKISRIFSNNNLEKSEKFYIVKDNNKIEKIKIN